MGAFAFNAGTAVRPGSTLYGPQLDAALAPAAAGRAIASSGARARLDGRS
ncbi:hypothetical protein AB0D08_04795 [Kitasatospora sp. NPDC048540]